MTAGSQKATKRRSIFQSYGAKDTYLINFVLFTYPFRRFCSSDASKKLRFERIISGYEDHCVLECHLLSIIFR